MIDLLYLYIFVLAAFVGYEVISRVPVILHTPLMSVTNAISSVIVVGAILAAMTVPALGVYGPELFPTALRAKANGLITLGSVAEAA